MFKVSDFSVCKVSVTFYAVDVRAEKMAQDLADGYLPTDCARIEQATITETHRIKFSSRDPQNSLALADDRL